MCNVWSGRPMLIFGPQHYCCLMYPSKATVQRLMFQAFFWLLCPSVTGNQCIILKIDEFMLLLSSLIEFFETSFYNVQRLVGSTHAHFWAATLLLFDVAKYKATVQRNSRARIKRAPRRCYSTARRRRRTFLHRVARQVTQARAQVFAPKQRWFLSAT